MAISGTKYHCLYCANEKIGKEMRAGKVVNKYKMGKFIIFEGEGEHLTYSLDESKIEQESRLDGCYVIYTECKE